MSVYGIIDESVYDYGEIVLEFNAMETLREIKRKIKEAFRKFIDRLSGIYNKLIAKDSKYKSDPNVQKFKSMAEKASSRMSEVDDIESAKDAEEFKNDFESLQSDFEQTRKNIMECHNAASQQISNSLGNIYKNLDELEKQNKENSERIDDMLKQLDQL